MFQTFARRLSALLSVCGFIAGCGGGAGGGTASGNPNSPSDPSSPLPTTLTVSDLAFCASETNRYRAMVGAAPVSRSSALESFAAAASQADHQGCTPHAYVLSTGFGNGLVRAENQVVCWSLTSAPGRSVQGVMQQMLAGMWAEGPGGGHYENIRGPYTQVGCGGFIQGSSVTITQDFR